ncbi:MAG TPA: 2-C-methyl-D-erythritol 4-phosphate cytidylyltransferase [Burkholderiaceae bacterium]|nr:2-C-methyl-D-erythritol 4-phosphate cytidylyltransferase [Burkholderiaceae bacterium]
MARFHAVVPAAGSGVRMGAARPKQFEMLGGRTLLARALQPLLDEKAIERVVVVVAPAAADAVARAIPHDPRIEVAPVGGASRAASVRNGLARLSARAAGEDFVLVHDAARPCLGADELRRLLHDAGADAVGGLLAQPVGETLKRAVDGRVVQTIDRTGLWRAATPQMFRLQVLSRALDACEELAQVTDEAAAVERLGLQPLLVPGAATNLKVTTPADWALAEAILRMQQRW